MAATSQPTLVYAQSTAPVELRPLRVSDLHDALRAGWEDFKAIPSHAIMLALIYPVIGLVVARFVMGYSILPLLFPIAAGFALIGPFAAIGLYELSRRRELGMDASAWHAAEVLRSPSLGAMIGLGVLLFVIFGIWIAAAQAIYVSQFGNEPASEIPNFVSRVLTSPEGQKLIMIGCSVGFAFAVAALCLSVIAFPMMLDRHAGLVDAVTTSLRVTAKNPVVIAIWGLMVAGLLVVGSLPFFLGLTVVIPLLGHATWHLYRKAIVPATRPSPSNLVTTEL